jgi:hypothetical protein
MTEISLVYTAVTRPARALDRTYDSSDQIRNRSETVQRSPKCSGHLNKVPAMVAAPSSQGAIGRPVTRGDRHARCRSFHGRKPCAAPTRPNRGHTYSSGVHLV